MIPEHQRMHIKMRRIDRFLWKMSTELLWYTYNKCESILNHRADNKEKI